MKQTLTLQTIEGACAPALTFREVCGACAAAGKTAKEYLMQRARAARAAAAAKVASVQAWLNDYHDFRVSPDPEGEPEIMTGWEYLRMVVIIIFAFLALSVDYDALFLD